MDAELVIGIVVVGAPALAFAYQQLFMIYAHADLSRKSA